MTQAENFGVPTTGPASPDVMASRIQENFEAALTGHSGSSRPAYAEAGTVWQDTSVSGLASFYFYDGLNDILLYTVDTASNRLVRAAEPWVDVATASTVDLGAVTSGNIRFTGTTTVTGGGTAPSGTKKKCRAASAFQLTHHPTSFIMLGGASIAVVAGDIFELVSLGSGNWVMTAFEPTSGVSLRGGLVLLETKTILGNPTNLDFTGLSAAYDSYELVLRGLVPTTGGADLYLRAFTDGGTTPITSSTYNWGRSQIAFGSTPSTPTGAADTKIILANNVSNDSALGGVKGVIDITIPATGRGGAGWNLAAHTGATEYSSVGNSGFVAAVNALRLALSGGTFQNVNSVSLYGKRK